MKQVHPTYLSLVIATHREAEDCTAPIIVTGFGMFSVRKLDPDDWHFSLNASVAETVDDEAALLISMADALPMPTFLVGEYVEQQLFAPLFQVADRLPPPSGAYVGLRVARLRRALPVDVTLGSAGRNAPLRYAEPDPKIRPVTAKVVEGKIIDRDETRARLEARAIGNWLRFVRCGGTPRVNISQAATLTWMASHGWKI
jgi:hypothetical protein